MSPAIASSFGIVAYLALFAAVGIVFLFVNLLVGRLLRPHDPHPEKLEIYECGEPTIGSSFVQFDLRFYVVALLFIIFDVEVAFFFPWAAVFGKATHLADSRVRRRRPEPTDDCSSTPTADGLYRELGVRNPTVPTTCRASLRPKSRPRPTAENAAQIVHDGARQLAWVTIVDIARVLRRADGRLRLRLEARRSRLGPRTSASEQRRRAATAAPTIRWSKTSSSPRSSG